MLTFIVLNLQIIGSRNPLNVIKALFIALNAVCAHLFLIIYQPIRIFAFLTLGAIDWYMCCLILPSTCLADWDSKGCPAEVWAYCGWVLLIVTIWFVWRSWGQQSLVLAYAWEDRGRPNRERSPLFVLAVMWASSKRSVRWEGACWSVKGQWQLQEDKQMVFPWPCLFRTGWSWGQADKQGCCINEDQNCLIWSCCFASIVCCRCILYYCCTRMEMSFRLIISYC